MTTAMLLSSGGLDSTTVAYWLCSQGKIVHPLFFDYGQHCVETEWLILQEVLPKKNVLPPIRVNISDVFKNSKSRLINEADLWTEHVEADDLYIPYRTLLFFSVAAAVAQTQGYTDVYSGFINSNHAKELDCSSVFLNGLEAFSANVGPVKFILPFRDKTKSEVVQIAKDLRVPIGGTFSCQAFSDVPCGACPNCVDRIAALKSMA